MLTSALILLGAAVLVSVIFYSLKLPPIVGFIAAGILVGPSGLALIGALPQVEALTEIAAVLLMFTIGLEFSLKELAKYRRPILILGIGQMLITIFIFSAIFTLAFEMSLEKALFISFLIAPSSTAIVFKLLSDHRDFETPYGKGAFSILLLQDIAFIPMLVIVPFLVARNSVSTTSFIDALMPMIILIVLVVFILFLLNRYGLPLLFHRVAETRNREIFFFTIVFICMGLAALMQKVGLSLSLGAFLAGMLLAGSNYSKQATAEILPLRDTFLSLFFIVIGMMLDVQFVIQNFLFIILLGAFVIALKAIILFAVIWLSGSTSNVSRAVTLLLFQFGEFSFILAEVGAKHGLLLENEKQYFVSIAIISLALTPYLYSKIPLALQSDRFHFRFLEPWQKQILNFRQNLQKILSRPLDVQEIPSENKIDNHVVVVGYGVAGQSLCRVLEHLKIDYRVIELNAETVRINGDKIPMIFGDAANPQLLKQAGIERARLVILVTSGVSMLEPILDNVTRLNPQVPVIARTNYLLDLKRLNSGENVKFVISELESTLEVLDETLREFKIEDSTVDQLINNLRTEMRDFQLINHAP